MFQPLSSGSIGAEMTGSAMAVASFGLLEALSIAKAISFQTRQPLDYNRQCLAEGLANSAAGSSNACPAPAR